MTELYAALLGWAVSLSGYPLPAVMPEVLIVPHHRLEELANAGAPSRTLGWYGGGKTIYLDDRLDMQNTFHSSILVHEFVHYLQGKSGKYSDRYTCDEAIAMEREAYGVQGEFLTRYGEYHPITAVHSLHCVEAAP